MPSSSTSTVSEPEEFEAALRRLTDVNLLVTEQGRFRGRLTQVALHRIHLVAADETVSRVAHISMRPNLTLVWWALARHGSQIWCGTPCLAGEFMTLGPGARAYARTEGACRWAGLWISATDLERHRRALTGSPIMALNGASAWRPRHAALQTLRALHAAAIRLFEHRAREVLTPRATHGLEQQLIHAVVQCLSNGVPGAQCGEAGERHNSLMARFEDACETYAHRVPALSELCAALGVSERSLRSSCTRHLGMGPISYLRLRRMKSVRHALRSACPADYNVAELARRHGFTELDRFAARYRQLFGELPSATLQRSKAVL
jgi:AraC-like DNA-binding protein